MADSLHDLAVLARRGQHIDYDSPAGIKSPVANESFSFPACWTDNLSLDDFIETVMHLLGLGIAPSHFDLITIFLKELPAGSGMSSTALRRAMQELLTDLKPLMLNWLNALPLNVSDKKGYTTGGELESNGYLLQEFRSLSLAGAFETMPCLQNSASTIFQGW